MDNSEVKDTESDVEANPMENDNALDETNGSDEQSDFAMDDEEKANGENDSNVNERASRRSSSAKVIQKETKTPEKKGQKRKSTSLETPANSKLPKFESMQVNLEAKTIYIREGDIYKYRALDRSRLTLIPTKEGTFEVGDLIWAKMVGYPWWPCLVSIDPETGNYSKITGMGMLYAIFALFHS